MSDLGNKEVFARNLAYYMTKFDVDRNKICSDLEIPYTTLSDWLNAKKYPRIDKIVLIKKYEKYAMSDCIIAITAASNNNAKKIYDAIIENWDEFFKLYNGTGAKYTTIDKIKSFFGY